MSDNKSEKISCASNRLLFAEEGFWIPANVFWENLHKIGAGANLANVLSEDVKYRCEKFIPESHEEWLKNKNAPASPNMPILACSPPTSAEVQKAKDMLRTPFGGLFPKGLGRDLVTNGGQVSFLPRSYCSLICIEVEVAAIYTGRANEDGSREVLGYTVFLDNSHNGLVHKMDELEKEHFAHPAIGIFKARPGLAAAGNEIFLAKPGEKFLPDSWQITLETGSYGKTDFVNNLLSSDVTIGSHYNKDPAELGRCLLHHPWVDYNRPYMISLGMARLVFSDESFPEEGDEIIATIGDLRLEVEIKIVIPTEAEKSLIERIRIV